VVSLTLTSYSKRSLFQSKSTPHVRVSLLPRVVSCLSGVRNL
jgi:hypothetical protein